MAAPHRPTSPDPEKSGDLQQGIPVVDTTTLNTNEFAGQEGAWDGPNDPEDPLNWPSHRKISIAVVFSVGQLVTLMSASMITPALHDIANDLSMTESTMEIAFSVYFLGLGFAPFLIAALAEMYGRKPVWLVSNLWYILWNALCPVGNSPALMVVGRIMASCGASAGVTLTGPVLTDMYPPKDRGKSLSIATFIPYFGPALGPIVGGLAAQKIHWRWLFWILSIFDCFVVVVGYFVIKESYAPVLLGRKAKRQDAAQHSVRRPSLLGLEEPGHAFRALMSRLRTRLYIPIRLLIFRPIVQLISFLAAVNFAIYTLLLGTFANLYIDHYDATPTAASLHYIAVAIGASLAAQIGGRLMDHIWKRQEARAPDHGVVPEYRVPYMVPAYVLNIAGLFWYGWAAEKKAHWAVVDVGVAVFTMGDFMLASAMLSYTFDEFGSKLAASAGASTRMLTYILGFAFPVFAPALYSRLGYGWGNSLLAFLSLVLNIPGIAMIWFWGPRLRARGRREEERA